MRKDETSLAGKEVKKNLRDVSSSEDGRSKEEKAEKKRGKDERQT
jgi:hypothetical protein